MTQIKIIAQQREADGAAPVLVTLCGVDPVAFLFLEIIFIAKL